jgi:MGT family glycosyltransferase
MSLNFLFTSFGNPGNLNPFLTAARRLRQRGHRVRFLGEPDHHEETTAAGFDALSWRRPPRLVPPEFVEDAFWAEVNFVFDRICFGAALDYASDTMDALRTEPVDVLVTNDILAGPAIAAEASGIPYALLSPHVSLRPLEGVPGCGSGLFPGEQDREKDRAYHERYTNLLGSFLPVLNRARAAFGLAPLKDIFDHHDRADRFLIALSAAFDFPATSLPSNMRYVGPLLDLPNWTRPWMAPWSGSPKRPRVLVSLSTSFQDQADLLGRIISALGTMELDAVVTVGPAMEKLAIEAPANVTIVHSAPHDTVMKEVSLVVNHGGHGTMMRALLNGVPQLVIAMGRDQFDNAARLAARGAGLTLTAAASREEIVTALGRLIAEPRFKEAAIQLGKAIAQDATSPVLVTELEKIAARRLQRSA